MKSLLNLDLIFKNESFPVHAGREATHPTKGRHFGNFPGEKKTHHHACVVNIKLQPGGGG